MTTAEIEEIFSVFQSDSSKQKSRNRSVKFNTDIDGASRDDTPADLKDIPYRVTHEECESKEVRHSAVRKLTADMTERGRKIGAHLESIHGYVVKDCTNLEESQDQCLSEELADELRKRTTSVDSEIKQLENQMGQLQRTLVKGKARRESIKHRMSVSSPNAGRKASALSSTSSSEMEELTLEEFKAQIELLENEKLEWIEDKKDLGDEIKFLKYQLQYRIDVQSLQNDTADKTESDKLAKENESLREENCKLKERLSTIKAKLKEKGNVEENLLSIADVSGEPSTGVSAESEIERLHTERKILLSTIMRMQSLEKDEEESVSFADFGVQVDLNKLDTIDEDDTAATPLVAKLTKENKALKKHITDMQKELDEYEKERKALNEENFKLIDEKRSLEDTINKLRTQMSDTLDTTLDEIEQLHAFNEDLEGKFKRTESNFKDVLKAMNDLQSKNCKALERMLDEAESKITMEEVFDYLDHEVSKLIKQNRASISNGSEQPVIKKSKEDKQFSSNLLKEVMSCKELLESQRSHIRKLQLDKRDIEEGYTNMKRELLLLKSSKQRARENSKELQFLKKRRAKSLNDGAPGAVEATAVLDDKESLQREIKRLGSVKAELENTVQKLKKEKATLGDEKVCLLGSLYHQLERNESLEIQIEELSVALQQWEAKSDLENDAVFEEKIEEDKEARGPEAPETQDQISPGAVSTENGTEESEGDVAKEVPELSPSELDVEVSGRPVSPIINVVSSATNESMQEMKHKIHALGEQLRTVQESVCELETERETILEDLEDSKKNEKELRNVIVQLNRENSIQEDKLANSNQFVETLQIRFRETQAAKEEATESLQEANEEKIVSKKHCQVLDKRLKEVTLQRDQFKEKTEKYNQCLKEILSRVAEVRTAGLTNDEDIAAKEETSTEASTDSEDVCIQSKDDLQKEILDGLSAVQTSISEIKTRLDERDSELHSFKNQLQVSIKEKDALQKSLRETDEKKKQLKGFITKLTEEKEKVNEQLDEMKQQKSNLADALENVYQSKEKLQNRLTEALCKQEQYKNSLIEVIDEAKTLKESLYRMVNEHETMKESLLIANREVERLKSQQGPHRGSSAMNVIEEEDEKPADKEVDEKGNDSEEEQISVNIKHPEFHRKNISEVLDKLKQSLKSLSRENALFESQVKQLLCSSETQGEGDVPEKEEVRDETPPEKVDEMSIRSSDEKGVGIEEESTDSTEKEEQIFLCVSEKLSKDEETLSEIQVQTVELERLVEEAELKLQSDAKEHEDNEAISGLMKLQEDILSTKLDSEAKEAELVEWFEVISAEKENLEKELENASKDNIELLKDMAKLREEKEALRKQLEIEKTGEEKSEKPIPKEKDEQFMPLELQRELQELENDGKKDDLDQLYTLEKLHVMELKDLAEKLQKENKLLNNKITDLLQKSKHFNTIDVDLEKSNQETRALEKQVDVLSKEGATLRVEADERVQRLIELEENMILAIEKKLELAEYASFLTSKKDCLEKKCEELSREVEGITKSRDEILALKSQSDEQMHRELKELKEYKEKAVREIEDLNDILRIGRQDFEAIKIELDSMQRKNRVLKQELEKASTREEMNSNFQEKLTEAIALKKSSDLEELNASGELELLKLKTRELESELQSANERTQHLEKERDELFSLLSELTRFYDAEVKKEFQPEKENGETSVEMEHKVSELKSWIKCTSEVMESYAQKSKMLSSFVLEVEEKTSEVLEREEILTDGTKSSIDEDEALVLTNSEGETSKESFENARCKFELLIKKLKESFQNETSFQTQLGQIKEDNERITAELNVKSNFLQTMRNSFQQLLLERNLLAEKAVARVLHPKEGEQNSSDPEELSQDLQNCTKCRNLERERDELKSTLASMKEDSVELNRKCRLLKEHLILLKQQQDSIANNNIQADLDNRFSELPNLIEETVSQNNFVVCQSAPVFESELEIPEETTDVDITEETPDIEPVTSSEQEILQGQSPNTENEAKEDEESSQATEVTHDRESGPEEQLKNLQAEMETLRNTNRSLKIEVSSLKEKIKEIKHEHHRETTELKKEFYQQEHELDELQREKEERRSLIDNLKSKIEDLKSISQLKEYPQDEAQEAPSDGKESVKLHKMLAKRSSSLKDLNEKLGVSKNFMQKILDENKQLKEEVTELALEQKESKRELEVLKAELDLKKTALVEVKDQKAQLETTKSRLEEDAASMKDQLKSRGILLAILEKDKESFKANLRKTQQEELSLMKQCELLQELSDSGKQRQKDTENLVKKLNQSCDEMTANFEKVSLEKKDLEGSLTEELQIERSKTEESKEKMTTLEKNHSWTIKCLEEYKEKVQTLTRELRRDKSRRDREIGSIKQENAKLLSDEKRIQKELENFREQLEDERNKNDNLETDLKTAIIDNLTLNNSLKVQSVEKDKTSKELEGNRKESKRLCTLTGDLKAKIANLDALLKATKDEKKFLADEIEKLKAVNTDLRLRLTELSEDKEELEDILGEMREKRQKQHDEIDKALTERDEVEDHMFDIKKKMTKKMESVIEENKNTEEALEKLAKEEAMLQQQLQELEKSKLLTEEKNSKLKDDLEKTKSELIQLLQIDSQTDETKVTTYKDNENVARQLQEAQAEVGKLSSALEKSQKEIENLKTKLESKVKEQETLKVTIVQREVQSSVNASDSDKTPDLQAQISNYIVENMRLRAQLEETECKVITLQAELFNLAKKEVHEEFKLEATKRECQNLKDDLRKSKESMSKLRVNLQVSNAAQTDLRKNLRAAVVGKEKYENDCKRLMLQKGIVEKVKVTSMEVPSVYQIQGLDREAPLAKAASLDSARKEIVILEAQVKDMRARITEDREVIEELLSEITKELNRAMKVLAAGQVDENDQDVTSNGLHQSPNIRDKLCDLRKMVDSLEQVCRKPQDRDLVDALSKDESRIADKLRAVMIENIKLSDKMKFLQDEVSGNLEEKKVLEDIGFNTRKELSAIVQCLSSEREQLMSISNEREDIKAKFVEAEKNMEELKTKISSLQKECADLRERNQRSETPPEIKIEKQELQNAVESSPFQMEDDLKTESKHLEMELMEQDRELQWLRKELKELTDKYKKLEEERNSIEAAHKKVHSQNQDLYAEMKRKERQLNSYREDNQKLLTIQKTSETQIRHLNREIELFSDRVVCCETDKEQLEEVNRQQQNEIQEMFLQKSKDNVVREKLENLFYENTKLKEQKKMLSTRIQSLEQDMKSQILTTRDLESEKQELFSKIDRAEDDKRNENSKKERLAYLLDKHDTDSRRQIDALTRVVEKLTRDKDELCAQNPRLDKIHLENKKLGKESAYKDGVIGKLQDQNYAMNKEIDLLHRSYDNLRDNQKGVSTDKERTPPPIQRSSSLKFSPRRTHQSGSKTSSFSSLGRASFSSGHVSDSSDRNARYNSKSRTPSRRREDGSPGDPDSSSVSSQECFCSPILSVVNLCPYEVQKAEDLGPPGRCPVCRKKKPGHKATIKEHYV